MNSKIDQSIKRYLKSISVETVKAKCNNSYYYILNSDEEIRFSDHTGLKAPTKRRILDIIKCTQSLYRLRIDQFEIIIEENIILPYLKSLILLAPWIKSYSVKLNDSFIKQSKQIVKLQNTIDKLQRDSDIVDSVFEDNRQLKNVIKELKKKNLELSQSIDKLNQKYTKLKSKCDNFINAVKNG